MANSLELLRLKRLAAISNERDPFAANIRERVKFPVVPNTQPTMPETPLAPTPVSTLESMRARPTPRIKEYMSYLESEPQRKDYQANKLSKILAAVSGTIEGAFDSPSKGISTYKGITDMPYIEAMDQHDRKGGRLKELADLEYRGLTDEQKLAIQMQEYQLKSAENARQWIELESGLGLKKAQIENITNQIKTRGLIVEDDEITGEKIVVDKVAGTRTPLGKFAESMKDKDIRARSMFQFQSGVTEGRQSRLQEDAQAAALNLESIRTMNDGELARYRTTLGREDEEIKRKLEGMSPAAQKTALELAYQQAELDNPELREANPTAFMNEVRKRLKGVRERTRKDVITNVDEDPFGLLEN